MPPIRHTGVRIKLEPETSPPPELLTPPQSQESTPPRSPTRLPADEVEFKKETQTEQTEQAEQIEEIEEIEQPEQAEQTDNVPTDSDPEWTQRILNMCIILRREELGLPELPRDGPEYPAADNLSHPLEPPPGRKWNCYCGKPASKILCEHGRLENRGKWFFRCEDRDRGGCDYWEWIESEPEKCLRSHIVAKKWPFVIRKQKADQRHYMY
jgi:hypothetical protein